MIEHLSRHWNLTFFKKSGIILLKFISQIYHIKITKVTKILIGQQVINLRNSCSFQQRRYLEKLHRT